MTREGDAQRSARARRGEAPRRSGADRRARRGVRDGGFGPYGRPDTPEPDRAPQEPRTTVRHPAPLRVRGQRRAGVSEPRPEARRATPSARPRKRRTSVPADVESEILTAAGRRGPYLLGRFAEALDAYNDEHDREAMRTLRPVRDALPGAPSVHELAGLIQYRLGNYRAAAKELSAYAELTSSVEHHPILMDCLRGQRRWRRIEELWAELSAVSPSAQVVAEGRIVAAGALADRHRLDEAIALLSRKADAVKRPQTHHLRLWYALGDLEERAGNLARARALFERVRAHDPDFVDVAARAAALR